MAKVKEPKASMPTFTLTPENIAAAYALRKYAFQARKLGLDPSISDQAESAAIEFDAWRADQELAVKDLHIVEKIQSVDSRDTRALRTKVSQRGGSTGISAPTPSGPIPLPSGQSVTKEDQDELDRQAKEGLEG